VFNGVGWGEVAALLVIGLFVFGPDKLPRVARDAGRMLRQLRQMANGMREDLRSELGPELADLDIRDLHPKTFVRKHLLEGDDEALFSSYLDKRTSLGSLLGDEPAGPSLTKDAAAGSTTAALSKSSLAAQARATTRVVPPAAETAGSAPSETPWDTDAT
jgi:sec-independent protein translocase protein TatB